MPPPGSFPRSLHLWMVLCWSPSQGGMVWLHWMVNASKTETRPLNTTGCLHPAPGSAYLLIWLGCECLSLSTQDHRHWKPSQARDSGILQGQILTNSPLWVQPRKALNLELSAGILGAPLPGINPKGKNLECEQRWTWQNLFVIARIWKQSRSLALAERLNALTYIQLVKYCVAIKIIFESCS